MLSRIMLLKYFFRDPNKKSTFKILKEATVFGWIKKEIPVDYFRKFLYRKEVTNYKDYLTLKEYYSIIYSKKILNPDIASIFENKLSFSLFVESHNLPAPKVFSYNVKNRFFFNTKTYHITDQNQLKDFFTKVLNDKNIDALFIKPISGIGGENCILLQKSTLESQIKQHANLFMNNNFIHQEKITQHEAVNKMHAKSINTLRINTYLDKQGKSHVLSALMRFGSGNLITDNESAGGFYIALDVETETLTGVGRQSITKGSYVHKHHPDSKLALDGFKIPLVKEALDLAKEAAIKMPTRIIGWDIAISTQGPLIIEGNTNPSLNMADIAYGGYCKHPLIKVILKEVNS